MRDGILRFIDDATNHRCISLLSGIYEAKAADMKVEQQLIGNFAINFILINREIRSGDFDKFVNTLQQLPRVIKRQ